MDLLLVKTIHIISVISWFAGLFYLGRIFVYHRESFDKEEVQKTILAQHFQIMETRVHKIIMNPALVITWLTGLLMIHLYGYEWFNLSTWLHYKIGFVILLTVYHFHCTKVIKGLKLGQQPFSSFGFRLYNEVPTIFMILIVSLAIYKNAIGMTNLLISITIIIIALILLTKLYKLLRDKK